MTDRPAASRPPGDAAARKPLFTPVGLALRALVIAAVIGAAVAWPLLHGGHLPGPRPPPFHLHWPRLQLLAAAPTVIRLHVAAALTAFAIGAALLAGVKGTTLHKALGWAWVAAMMTTALGSFFIRVVNPGHWSFIHFLSGWVAIGIPIGLVAIRRKNVRLHRRMMTGQFVGGLVIAGLFTLAPGRLMYEVVFG